jgi:hypothetical protein
LYRLHLHLNGGSGEGFRPWLSEWARHLASAPAVRKLRLHLPEPYDNAHPSPHGDHHVSDERKDIGVIEIGFASALAAREFWESETYRATIADQRRYLRSVGAFRCLHLCPRWRDHHRRFERQPRNSSSEWVPSTRRGMR